MNNKQSTDVEQITKWISEADDDYEPVWLKDVSIPKLTSVSTRGAVANLLKCLINRESTSDPLTGEAVVIGSGNVELHHVFPRKYVSKLDGWDVEKGDKVDLMMNLIAVEQKTNVSFLNDDPAQQVRSAKQNNANEYEKAYAIQGVSREALSILQKADKTREDYWNFLKLRESHFESLLRGFGFEQSNQEDVEDDMDLA